MQEIFIQFHQHIMDADRIPVLVIAILTTAVVGMVTGPFLGNAHPFAWSFWDGFLGGLGDKLDKSGRKRSTLVMRGLFLTLFALFDAYFLGQFLVLQGKNADWVEFLAVCACLTSGAVWFALLRLYFALEKAGKAEGAYYAISRTTRIDLNSTDDFGITRTGLSLAATSFDKGMVAPSVWYLIGGMPAMLLYSCLAALSWRFGKSGFSAGVGAVPLTLERLMGFVPTLFSAFLLTLAAAITPTAKMSRALKLSWDVRSKAAYEEGGAALSTLCWLLDVTLGGPVQDISGVWIKKSWIGPENATAQVGHGHLKRGIYINVISHLLLVLALLAMYLYASNRL